MSGTTSVPRPTFTAAGVTLPAELDLLVGVFADINAAFGNALNVSSLETPQGQLATSFTAQIADKNALFLYFVSQVDPTYSEGRMQDAIARIYYLTRHPARPTIVLATLRGAVGTPIPAGTLARTLDGTLYASLADGNIGTDGSVALSFACQTPGPVACPAGTLTGVYQLVPGWDSITNAADGVLGVDVENSADFELRRATSVAANGQGGLTNLRGAVLNVAGVLDAYVTDNPTSSDEAVGGVPLPAHSLYVCVAGGTDADVAQAIWTKKSPGVTMVGNTTVSVQDMSYTDLPRPSYPITFQRAQAVPIYVAVTLTATPDTPGDAGTQIAAALVNAFAVSSARTRIAGVVYAGRMFAVLQALGPWAADVIDVFVGTSNPPTQKIVQLQANQIASFSPANVLVTLA